MNKYIISMIIGVLGSGFSVIGSGVRAESLLKPQAPLEIPEYSEGNAKFLTGQAPLTYEYNLKGPLTVESEIITTTGTIKTISAFADCEGEVRLEISANGGSAYTRITNGQLLSDRFIPGNQLRFKVKIAEGGTLKKLILGFTDSSGVSRMPNNPQAANFKYHKPIYISGASEELFNYPLKIKIEKDIFPQGIYFTAADGESPLDYYVEEQGLIPGKGTVPVVLWVRIPEIPKEGTMIYMYYGNKDAVNESDGNKVFSFFDDFNAPGLDEKKWQVRGGLKKECSIEDGYLRMRDCTVVSPNLKMRERILEFKAKAEENAAIQAIVRGSDTGHFLLPFEEIVYSSAYPGAEHTIAINDVAKLNIGKPIEPLTYYIYKATLNQTGIIFERYSANYEKQVEIQFLDMGNLDEGYIGLKADGALLGGGSVYFDWVRVRPYAEVEPVVKEVR